MILTVSQYRAMRELIEHLREDNPRDAHRLKWIAERVARAFSKASVTIGDLRMDRAPRFKEYPPPKD